MIIIKKLKIMKMKQKKELLFQIKKKIKKLEMLKLLHNKLGVRKIKYFHLIIEWKKFII